MPFHGAFLSTRLSGTRPSQRYQRAPQAAPDADCSSPRPKRRIPWGVVTMIGLIILVESFVARNWLDFSDPVSLSWRFSAHAVRTRAADSQVLCLGDSLVKHGLIPSVIEAESGRRAMNLSAARAPTLMTYFILRRSLDAGVRPDAVIINAKPSVLIGGPDYNARYFEEILTLRECLELSQITRRAALMVSMVAGKLLPSLRGRLEIRSNVMAALCGETDRLHDINRMLWRNWTVNDGANVAGTDSSFQGEVTPEVAKRLYTHAFHVDRVNGEAIERLMRLASSHEIPIYWLLTPLSPALQAMRDQSGSETAYERLIRSVQARYPWTMTVLDARRAGYPPDHFVDATHLNSRGAIALSRAVARAIDSLYPPPETKTAQRWIALANAPEQPELVGLYLENVEQSKKALGLGTTH